MRGHGFKRSGVPHLRTGFLVQFSNPPRPLWTSSVPGAKGSIEGGLRGSLAAEDQVCDETEDRESDRDREPERPAHATNPRVLIYPQGDQEKRDVQPEEEQPEHGRRRGRRGLERERDIWIGNGRGTPSCEVRSGAG